MSALFQDLGTFITQHSAMAGVILGAVIFVESLAIVGAFVPATALMAATGVLVATGVLPLGPVLFWGCVGAVLGEALSYHLGRRAGPAVWRHRRLRSQRKSVARARLYFRRYGAASIFMGRFLGPLQAVVPLIAGATGMGKGRFHVANVLSALIWTPAMLAPGYVAAGGLNGWNPGPWIAAVAIMSLGCMLILQPLLDDQSGEIPRPT